MYCRSIKEIVWHALCNIYTSHMARVFTLTGLCWVSNLRWWSTEAARTVNYCILTLLLTACRDLKYTGDILQPVVEYVRDQYTTYIFTFAFKMAALFFRFYLCPTLIEAPLPDTCYAYLNLHIYIQHSFYYCYAKTANLGVEFAMQFLYLYF